MEPTRLFIIAVSALVVINLGLYIYLEFRLRRLFRSSKGMNLESLLRDLAESADTLLERQNYIDDRLSKIDSAFKDTIQHVGMVRFNPFSDSGGNQSFALALLDGKDSGVVVSSLYARDGVRIYAKPIVSGKSTYRLTTEEEQALLSAVEHPEVVVS